MALTGNKGEWSEIYVLFRLLGEGKVHAGDANLNKLNIYYPIIDVIRQESKKYEYKPDVSRNIVIIDEDGVEYARFPMNTFMQESLKLLDSIKLSKKSAFEIPQAESFMHKIGATKLKSASQDKADIHIVIHDMRTNMKPLLGFSIKSQLGSASTLFNAGKNTNILYRITGGSMTDSEMEKINAIENHLPRMKEMTGRGFGLEYADIEHQTFKNNLLFLDTCMPEFIADCLAIDSLSQTSLKTEETVRAVAKQNPLNFCGNKVQTFYEHKMKKFLLDVALGMTPGKEWDGRYDANGGYLIVKKDGDIVCYHFYNRNDVEDYLYHNTRFERASRSRYDFGYLFRGEDGQVYIRLNLQIRFTK